MMSFHSADTNCLWDKLSVRQIVCGHDHPTDKPTDKRCNPKCLSKFQTKRGPNCLNRHSVPQTNNAIFTDKKCNVFCLSKFQTKRGPNCLNRHSGPQTNNAIFVVCETDKKNHRHFVPESHGHHHNDIINLRQRHV